MGAVGAEATTPLPEDPRPPPKRIGLSTSGVFLIIVVIQFISYIPTYFLSHKLGVNGPGAVLIGTIQLFLLVASSVNSIGDLRIGSAFTYFVSRGEPPRQGFTTYLTLRLLLVAASAAALVPFGPTLHLTPTDEVGLFAVWMVFPVFWSLSTVYMQTWVALGDSIRSQVPQLVEAVVRAAALSVIALFAVSLSTPSASLWNMTWGYAIGVAASSVITLPTAWRYRGRFSWSEGIRMIRWAWPLLGSLILLYISGNLVNFVVALQLGRAQLTFFSAANGFRILALAIPTAVAMPLFPYIIGLHKRREYEAIRIGTWQALRYTAMVVVPGVVALIVYRSTVLNLFYSTYIAENANTALAILAVASVPAALSQIIGTALNSIGRQRLELYLTSVQVGVLFVGAPLLIDPPGTALDPYISGIIGASWAVLLSSVAGLALNTYFMERLLAVRIQFRPIASICLSAAVSFLAISRLNAFIHVNRYYSFAAGVVLGFAAYVLVLMLLGELTKADVELIGRTVALPRRLISALQRLCRRAAWPDMDAIPEGGAGGLREESGDTLGLVPDRPGSPPRGPPK